MRKVRQLTDCSGGARRCAFVGVTPDDRGAADELTDRHPLQEVRLDCPPESPYLPRSHDSTYAAKDT